MHRLLAQALDHLSIRMATRTVRACAVTGEQVEQAEALLHRSDFCGGATVPPPDDWRLSAGGRFQFTSPQVTPWPHNNLVGGRYYRCAAKAAERPTVVLVHGWNAEAGYHTLYPFLARRLNAVGLNAMTFELPYHGHRRPARDRQHNPPSNFLSGDLLHVVAAIQQAILDTRTLLAWLRAQGCERVGLWGISLGAWLAGMIACVEPQLGAAVLMTPVVRLDRVIAEAAFCEPLRRSLSGTQPDVSPMNLLTRLPRLAPEKILFAAARYDLFAPLETVEELQRAWHGPVLWGTPHGHISMLFSLPVMNRTVRWVADTLAAGSQPGVEHRTDGVAEQLG